MAAHVRDNEITRGISRDAFADAPEQCPDCDCLGSFAALHSSRLFPRKTMKLIWQLLVAASPSQSQSWDRDGSISGDNHLGRVAGDADGRSLARLDTRGQTTMWKKGTGVHPSVIMAGEWDGSH